MKFIAIAAPLFLLVACSPPAQTQAPTQTVQMSAEARTTMDQVNAATFASLAGVPAVPDSPLPATAPSDGTPIPAADSASEATQAEATVPETIRYDAAMVRIEVLLDRAHFSPGVIDGYNGDNVQKAVRAYQTAHDMPVNGQADDALLQALAAQDAAPALVAYTITAQDVAGPFAPVPQDLEAMSRMPAHRL